MDYLQLLSGTKHAENRTSEVTEITAGLKALAKELKIPIIALSQLSRDVEKREDKRPQLADLRDSGSIEQDADAVIFLFREEYYLERKRPTKSAEISEWTAEQAAGKAEAIIAKHRHGQVCTVRLQFDASTTRFSSLAFSGQHKDTRDV